MNQTQSLFLYGKNEYLISRRMGEQGPQSSEGNQAEVEKLAIGTLTDSSINNSDMNTDLQHKYMGLASPKETTATAKERSNLFEEVKADQYLKQW